jgi:uncharacterized repeat protein (TIGR01451 family)
MKKPVLLIILVLTCFCSFAQIWNWSKVAPGADVNMVGKSLVLDKFNNTIITTGFTNGFFGATNNFRMAKYDTKGGLVWSLYFTGGNLGTDLATDKSGNIYMFSARFTAINGITINSPNSSYLFSKFNPQGTLVWMKTVSNAFVNSTLQRRPVIKTDEQNNLYLGITAPGQVTVSDAVSTPSNGCSSCPNDAIIAKMDTAGHVLWIKRFENSILGVIQEGACIQDMDVHNGQILVSGFFETSVKISDTTLTGSGYYVTAIYTATGNRKWARKFGSSNLLYIPSVNNTFPNNNTVLFNLAGTLQFGSFTVNSTDNQSIDVFIGIMDSLGTPRKIFKPDTRGWGRHIQADNMQHYFITAPNSSRADVPPANVVIKTDTSGNTIYKLAPFYNNVFVEDSYLSPDGVVGITGSFVDQLVMLGDDSLIHTGQGSVPSAFVSGIIGNANVIEGHVFFDMNSNNFFDGDDVYSRNMIIKTQVPRFAAFTDTAGLYRILADTGTYQVSPVNTVPYYNLSPASYSLPMPVYGQLLTGKDFLFKPIPGINDLVIDVAAVTPIRPGMQVTYQLTCSNKGTTMKTGTISMKLNPALSFVSSDSIPVFINTDSISWNYTNLKPMRQRVILLRANLLPSTPNGQVIRVIGYANPVINDSTPADNIDTLASIVTASFDPNDKTVYPFKEIHIDSAVNGKQFLEYTIHFQNTGTDTAFNIRLRDSLSAKLNFSTFEILSGSHPAEIKIADGRNIEFFFPNILLPDSNRNEPKSHGFIKFRIKPVTTVSLTDTIFNKAAIYFDYNDPVITNSVTTTFRTDVITSVPGIPTDPSLCVLSPNPASDIVRLLFTKAVPGNSTCFIYNASGQIIFQSNWKNIVKGETKVIYTGAFTKGYYFVEVVSAKARFTKQFIRL